MDLNRKSGVEKRMGTNDQDRILQFLYSFILLTMGIVFGIW
jgi:hypothetical protein